MIAAAPSSTEVMTTSGVSFESMNARAMRPAKPISWAWGLAVIGLHFASTGCPSVNWRGAVNHHSIARIETGEDFHFVADAPAGLHEVQLGALVRNDKNDLHLAALHDRRSGHAQRTALSNRHDQPRKLARTLGNAERRVVRRRRQIQL